MKNLMRPDLFALKPYVSARTLSGGTIAAIGLDANENPWPPAGPLASLCPVNRYIGEAMDALQDRIACINDIPAKKIAMGRGSSEGIDLLIRLFCRAGQDEILICPPTFAMYQVFAATQGAATLSVPLLENGQLDVPAIMAACTPNTKLIFIPTPNAPMGHTVNKADILALCQARAASSVIVADEAYLAFTDEPRGLQDELQNTPNLVLLRTLSKAYALAGERIGFMIASDEIIEMVQRITAPYPLAHSAAQAALEALSPSGLLLAQERLVLLKKERARVAALLPQSPFITRIFDSVTNFFLIQVKDAGEVTALLARYGIRVRPNVCALPNTLRFSLGTPEENDILLRTLGITLTASQKPLRLTHVSRKTKETQVDVTVNLDAPSFSHSDTGIGFFDHMLEQVAQHGGFGLALTCKGDLHIDAHHTIEDCALTLGEAIKKALGDKRGLSRYGFSTPLDEALASVTLDLSGRGACVFMGTFKNPSAGEMPTEMVSHFFHSFAEALGAAIHITLNGENDHHKIEAGFKALGRALRQALAQEGDQIPSTKGSL